jgi:FkbM family methyltransferase
MDFFVNIAKWYVRNIFPRVKNYRGSDFIARFLSEIALHTVDRNKDLVVNGVMISKKIHNLKKNVRRRLISGGYEIDESIIIEEQDLNGDIIELGGGIGYISCLIDREKEHGSRHIVLEPNPEVQELLLENKELNDASFTLVQKAYSFDNSNVNLDLNEGLFWGASTYYDMTDQKTAVEGVSLENLVKKYEIKEGTLIMDIEGMENILFEEEEHVVLEKFNTIILEYHDEDFKAELIKKLRLYDFNLVREEGNVISFIHR